MFREKVLAEIRDRSEVARRDLIDWSDNNQAEQLVAAMHKAAAMLPAKPKPEWFECSIRKVNNAFLWVRSERGGYDYDWVVNNVEVANFYNDSNGWTIGGTISATYAAVTVTLYVKAKAPLDVIRLMDDMGFIQTEPGLEAEPPYEVFTCHA